MPPSLTPNPVRILLCDDQKLIRSRLREVFAELPHIQVVGEAATGAEAVKMAIELKPDIVLMDVSMPDMDGIEATRQIIARAPGLRVLAFSADFDADHTRRMFAAGACGYLLKTADPVELLVAIQTVLSGKRFISGAADGSQNHFSHD
jgi:DNA-binding NarL/FixJ family response regulator